MQKELSRLWQIIALGASVVLIPLLSIPRAWANILLFFVGGLIIFLGYLLARGIAQHVSTIDTPRTPRS